MLHILLYWMAAPLFLVINSINFWINNNSLDFNYWSLLTYWLLYVTIVRWGFQHSTRYMWWNNQRPLTHREDAFLSAVGTARHYQHSAERRYRDVNGTCTPKLNTWLTISDLRQIVTAQHKHALSRHESSDLYQHTLVCFSFSWTVILFLRNNMTQYMQCMHIRSQPHFSYSSIEFHQSRTNGARSLVYENSSKITYDNN